MPRALSTYFRKQMNSPNGQDPFLVLLTVRYQPTKTVFRAVNNNENITSRGNVYTAYPFQLALPTESGEEIGRASITIDNTDLTLVDMLREATEAPRIDIEVIAASKPDAVEIAILDLALRNVTWDANTITGELLTDNFLNQTFPGDVYSPLEWQGLF